MVASAIDAILGQTYSNLELIIVNDGSRDNSREVLDHYARCDSRVRVIHKENEGIPHTVNRGWREARGEYVTWTSDDNLYFPNTLHVLLEHLESHPETALVYADSRFIDGRGAVIGIQKCRDPEALEFECPIYGALLFRRSVFDKVDMFRPEWRRCHDFDFYHRVYKVFRVERIPQVLYDYRFHAESMTGNHWAITIENAKLLESYAPDSRGRRAAWGRCWHEIARQAQRDHRDWKAIWYYFRATIQQPSRFHAFWRSFWTTCYGRVPRPIQRIWRSIKLSRYPKSGDA
jgi:glycosyltransferase involved in cell wall biosynthesis